jgi:hypothetical protein
MGVQGVNMKLETGKTYELRNGETATVGYVDAGGAEVITEYRHGISTTSNYPLDGKFGHQPSQLDVVKEVSFSVGTKFDQGKLRLELVPVEATEAIAAAMTYGAKKYGDWNWAKGIDHSRLVGAALRHISAYMQGEDVDSESGNEHLAHALASLSMLVASRKQGLGKDDRPTYGRKK